MRVVLDTNVLISGIFFGGPPADILQAWRGKELELLISSEILAEYKKVGRRLSSRYSIVDIEQILVLIVQNSTFVEAPPLTEAVSRDHDDDKFLACALAGNTGIVVSGDGDLLAIAGYRNIKVLTPREFVDRYLP
ncbi:MAG: putative toxin-antitoxin system toxin component, PIN family [Gammaproteobacteria bacterium]|nr:putative toxin-antitoxin system toxin component, PIN family [Gammaproteobacteria bacterium]